MKKIQHVRTLQGYDAFLRAKYQEAMAIFMELKEDPVRVISLYPGFLPDEVCRHIRYPIEIPEKPGRSRA